MNSSMAMVAQDIECLFRPRSIAIVGVPRGFRAGKVFLLGLLDQGFPGPIYPVHPEAQEIEGLKAYASLSSLPDPVDMVIVLVPREQVPSVIEQCVEKKVKIVVLYTAGYRETDPDRGTHEERLLLEQAAKGGFRVLGPNCMGVYCPETGLAFFPGMARHTGHVGFLSQSGSLSSLLTNACASRRIFFSKVVSYGNGIDIDLPELLEYFNEDGSTHIVCVYCEGVRDGPRLLRALRNGCSRKPLVFWKVGMTSEGRQAAASHTGALCGESVMWSALFRQFGVTSIQSMDECLDTLTAFSYLSRETASGRGQVAVISGPGGPAVSAADAVGRYGLTLAPLSDTTRTALRRILPTYGTSIHNPVDVGLAASFSLNYYLDTLEIVAKDPAVDLVLMVGSTATEDMNRQYIQGIASIRDLTGTLVVAIAYPGFFEDNALLQHLWEVSIPVYATPERALCSYSAVVRFQQFRSARACIG